MSVVLAVLAVTFLIVLRTLHRVSREPYRDPVLVKRYLHPGHTWLKVTDDGEVLVGVDEFALALIGQVDRVELPHLLQPVRQGDVAIRFRHGSRVADVVSPVTGWVIEKNEMVRERPGLVNSSPYGDGWLFKVHPRALVPQLRNLFTGRWAQAWQDLSRSQLHRLFSVGPGVFCQDGGEIVADFSGKCSRELWERISSEFFLLNEKEQVPEIDGGRS